MMQKLTRAWKPQLSLLTKTSSYRNVVHLPRPLKTAPANQVFFTTKSSMITPTTTTATEPPPSATATSPSPSLPPVSNVDPALAEYRQHIAKATAATTAAKAAAGSGTAPASIDNAMIHQLWHHYETIRGNAGLTREDYTNLRAVLWKNKLWGSEDRILQLMTDMKQQGHAWATGEYNEYFLVKLYQARYQDILTIVNGDEFMESGVKLSGASFNALLASYIKLDLEPQAAQLIKQAGDQWGVVPDIRDFDRCMRRYMPRDTDVILKGRTWIAQYGFDQVHIVDTNLQHLFRNKLVDDGIWIYEQLVQSQQKPLALSTCTLLIKNLADANKLRLAADIYDNNVRRAGLGMNPTICGAMLVLYAHRRQADKAEAVVRDLVKAGYPVDEITYNQLIKVYFKARQTRKALLAFEELQRHPTLQLNDIILNTMVDGLVINREIQAASHLYKQILAKANTNIKPDMVTFNTLFKGFVKAKEFGQAGLVIQDMYKHHCEPDTVTYTTLIDSIFEYKQPKTTHELMNYVERGMGMTPNIYTFNAMINGWVRHRNMDEAEATFTLLQSPTYKLSPTIHTMTNMIQGYVEISNLPKAMQTFQHCVSRGIKPDRAAYNFLITGFLDYDRIDDAVVCVQHMRKSNLNPTKDTWNMLLDACVRQQLWSTGALLVKEIEASGFAITNPALRKNYLRLKMAS